MRITKQMFDILKLHLQGKSPYAIARALGMDPPTVYVSLKAAIQNFAEADKMLTTLKNLGWPSKLAQVKEEIRSRAIGKKEAASEELAIKFG